MEANINDTRNRISKVQEFLSQLKAEIKKARALSLTYRFCFVLLAAATRFAGVIKSVIVQCNI